MESEVIHHTMMNGTNKENLVWSKVSVRNPITHNTWDHGKYTTYEIAIETNNPAFTLFKSCVRRRFSEFQWLKDTLQTYNGALKVPALPSRFVLGVFKNQYDPAIIHQRMKGLEEFVKKIVEADEFLAATATHLFLQSCIITPDIERIIKGLCKANVPALIKETGCVRSELNQSSPIIDSEYSRFLSSGQFTFDRRNIPRSLADGDDSPLDSAQTEARLTIDIEDQTPTPPGEGSDPQREHLNLIGSNSLQRRHGSFCEHNTDSASPCQCNVKEETAESSFSAAAKNNRKSVTFCNEVIVAEMNP